MDAEPKRPPPPKSYVPLVLLDGPPELPPRPQAEAEDPSPPHPSQGSPVPTPRSSHPSSQGSPVPRPRSHSHSSSSSSPVPRPRVKHPPSVEQTASNSVQSHQETAQASTADAQSSGVRSLQGSAETEPFPVKPIRRKNKRGGTQPVSSIATTPETHSNGDSATTESLPPRSLSPQYDEPLQRRHTMAAARPQLKRYPAPSQPAPPPPREETDSPGPRKKEMPRPPPPYAGRSSTLKKGLESSSPAAAAGGGGRGGKSLGTKAPPPVPAAAATSGGVSRPPPVRPSRPPAVSPPPAGMMTSSPSLRARSATIATTSPKYSREASPKPGARPDITIVSAQPMTGDLVPPPASSLSPQRSAARPPPARLQRKHPDTTSLEAGTSSLPQQPNKTTPSSKEHPKESALHHRGRPPPPHPGRVNEPAKASPPLPRRPHPQHPVPRPPPPQPKSSPALSKKHEVGPPPEEEPPEPPTEEDIEQHEAEHGIVLSTAPATALTAAGEPKKSKSVSFATLPDTGAEELPEPVKQTRPRPPAPPVVPRPTPSPEPSSTATEDAKVLLHPARPAIVPRATPSPEPDPKTRPAIVPRASVSPELPRKEPDPKTRPSVVPRPTPSPELATHKEAPDTKTRPSVVPRPTPSPELASHKEEPDPKTRPSVVPRPTHSPELASHGEEPDPKSRPSVVPRASRASPDPDTGHQHEETTQASKKQMAAPKRPSMKRPPAPKKKPPDSEPGKSESGVEREGKGEAVNERKQAPRRPTAPSRKHEQPQAVATVEEKAVERKEGDRSAAAKPEKMVKKEPPKRPSMKRPAPPKVTRKEPPSATVSAEENAPKDTPLLEESEQQVEHKQQPDNELKSTPNSNDDEQKSPSPTESPTLQQSTSPVEDQSGAEEHIVKHTASSTEPVKGAAHKAMPKRPPPAKRPPPPSRRATVKQAHTETETKTETVAKIDSSTVAVKEHVTSTTEAAATPRESVSPTEEQKESPPSASLPQDHNTHPGEATPTKQPDPAPSSEPVSKPAPKRPSFRKPPPPKHNLKQETMRTEPTPSEVKTASNTSPTEATPRSPSDGKSGSPTLEPSLTPSQPKQSPSPSPEVPENTPDQRPASTSPVQPSSTSSDAVPAPSTSAPAKRPSFRKPPPPKTTPSHEVTNASVAMLDATSSEEEEEKEEERKIEEKKAIKKPAAKPPPPKRSSSLNTITPQQPPPDTHKTLETLAEPDKAAEPDRLAEPDKVVEPEKAPEEPLKQATTPPQPSAAVAGSVVEQASSTPPAKHSPPKKLPPAKRPPPPSKRPTIKKTTTTTTTTTTTEAPEPPAEVASQSASPANAAIDAEKSESKIERKKARPPSMRRPPPPKMGGAKTGAPHTSPATQQKVGKPPNITSPDKQPETQTNMQPEALNETQADKNAGTPEANANIQVEAVAVPASLAEAVEGAKHVQPAEKEEEEGEVASPPGDTEQGEEDVKASDSTVPREGEGPPSPGETDQLTDEAGGGGGGGEEEQAEDKPTANSQELSPEVLEGAGLRRTPSGRIKGEASEDSGVRIIRYSTAADTAAGAANVKARAKKTDRPKPPRPVSMPPPGRPGKPPAPRTAQGKPGRPGPPPKPAPPAAKPAPGRKPPPHKASHKEPSSSGPPSLPPRPEPGHPLYKYVCLEPHGLATAVFEATASDELSYQEGDVIELLEKVDENWYYARNTDTGLQDGLILARSMNIIKRLPGQDTVAGFDDGPCAVAMHDFIGQSMDELSFSAGDLIMLKARVDDTWLKGKLVAGGEGIFPKNFVEIVEDLPPEPAKTSPAPTSTREERTEQIRGPHCVAMYAFIAEGSDELSLSVGDVVALVGRKRGGAWLRGSLRGREGIFPSDFVEIKEDLPPGVGEEEEKGNQTAAGKGNQTAAGKGNQTTAGKGNQTTAVKVHVVSALHNFSGDAGELSFRSGDKITVTARIDDQWLRGECKGQTGTFPAAFVDSVPADLPKSDGKSEKALEKPSGGGGGRCEAVFDFTGEGSDEMTFRKGDTITNLTKVDDDWLRGTLAGKEGIFPSNFVKILDEPLPPPPTKASSPPVPKEPAPSRTVGSKPKQSVDELLPRAEALFDYNAGNSEEISFKEGDMLYLLTKEGPEWYNGEHTQTGAIGQFPVSYVDVIEPLP